MRRLVFLVIGGVLAAGAVSAATPSTTAIGPAMEAPTLRAPGVFDRAAEQHWIRNVHAWLMSEQVVGALGDPVTIRLTDEELLTVESGICTGCERSGALLAGIAKEVSAGLELERPSFGAKSWTPDGGIVWTGAVRSPDAAGLRVHFTDFRLPPGYELYLYTEAGEVFGPYADAGPLGTGEFWSHTVSGPEAVLQLRRYGPPAATSRDAVLFRIAELGHVGSRALAKYNDPADHPLCDFNASCVENAACYNDPAVADAKYAVAHIQFVKRPYIYFCSGGLLNDSLGSETPYFLTANHCLSRDREASTLEAYFQFWTDCNNPQCPEYNQITAPRTLGASVLSTSKTGDYTLMQLSEPAPAGSAFLGWKAEPVAGIGGYPLYRIAHPGGAPQSYSQHTVDPEPPAFCSSWPIGSWIYSHDVVGATEGGSSGSPVVNADGQVVGQLSGGCGYTVYDECDNDQNSTVDGAFASYYSQVAPWLAPAGGCQDADLDGYEDAACGGTDCNDGNALINPGMTEDCANGVDDDCDGLKDGADPECGSSCVPTGEACTTNAECCSGRCHPRFGTCK
jgi:hypothetical protein